MYRGLETRENYDRRYAQLKSRNIPDIISTEQLSPQDQWRLVEALLPGDDVYCDDEAYTYFPDYREEDSMPFFISHQDNMIHGFRLESITKMKFTHEYNPGYVEMFYHYIRFADILYKDSYSLEVPVLSSMKNVMSYAHRGGKPSEEDVKFCDVYVAPYDCNRLYFSHDLKDAIHAIYLGIYNVHSLENAFPSFREQRRLLLSNVVNDLAYNCSVFLLESGEFLVGCGWYEEISFDVFRAEESCYRCMHNYSQKSCAIANRFQEYVNYMENHSSCEFPKRGSTEPVAEWEATLVGIGTEKFIIGYVDMTMYGGCSAKPNAKTNFFSY